MISRGRLVRMVLVAIVLGAASIAFAQGGDGGDPLEYLPADHWAYEELERLAALGAISPDGVRSRPLPRTVIARILSEALDDSSLASDPGLLRLRREFAREIGFTGRSISERETAPLIVVQNAGSLLRISPTAGLDLTEESARRADFGPGTYAGVRASVHVPPHFTFSEDLRARKVPGASDVGDALIKGTDIAFDLERFDVAIRTGSLELVLGRDHFRWGPSRSGGLLLSGAAPSWTSIGYAAQIGSHLRATALHGTLNAKEGRYLAGHRLEWAPGSRVVAGVAELARYQSPSPELLYVLNLVPYTVVERLLQLDTEDKTQRHAQRNNVLYSADVSARVARGQVVYAEALADDIPTETSHAPDRVGLLAGHRAVFPLGSRRLNAGFEAAKVWNYVYSVYYLSDCACNLSHRGEPLGFPDGPDVERLDLWTDLDLSRDWRIGVQATLRRHGEGRIGVAWSPFDPALADVNAAHLSGTVETRQSIFGSATWWPADIVEASVQAGFETVKHPGNDPGAPVRRSALASLLISARY